MKNLAAGRICALRAAFLLGTASFALAAPTAVFAQDGEAEMALPADDIPEDGGNVIIVTATKREQTLQEIPVAVTVTSGEAIERQQIRDLKDLQTLVPSLRVSQLQSTANTNFIIRGFGNGANNAGIEPSVGVFVDGVYRSRTASQLGDLPDVQRIEVLRGPQSTLFGKNASAGVISIITQEPQFDLGGSVEASYGNYNAVLLKGRVTGPLSDSIAASIAGGYNSRDGYLQDLNTGNDVNGRNRWFVRGQMLFEPSSDLKIRLIGDYDKIDENCCGVINLEQSAATLAIKALGGMVPDSSDIFADVVYNNFDSSNDITNWGLSGQADYSVGPLTFTSITAYRQSHAVTSQDSDFSSLDLINPKADDVRLNTFTQEFRASAEIGDIASALLGVFYINENVDQTAQLLWGTRAAPYADFLIQSLSGGALALTGTGPAPVPLDLTFGALEGNAFKYAGKFFTPGSGFNESYTLKSEALSIFGQVDFEIADGLTLTLGGNYTHDSKRFSADAVSTDVFAGVDFDNPLYAPFRYQLLYNGGLAQQVGNALMLGRSATQAEIVGFATNPASAATYGLIEAGVDAFAMGNANNPAANPLDPLRALQFLPPFVAVPNAVEDGKVSDNDFSYTIRLAYDLSDDVSIYASYATGFKAASVNLSRDSRPLLADIPALALAGLTVPNLTAGGRFADPEESAAYEAGLKANFGRSSANIAVFHQEIEGFQSNIFTGSGFRLANAGKQSTVGVEFEGTTEVSPGFTINAAWTYLDAVYDSFQFSGVGDISGTRPGGVPEWTVVLGATYDHEFHSGDHLILSGAYIHESPVQAIEGLPGFIDFGRDVAIAKAAQFPREVNELSASLTYAMESGMELSIWGRNLTDDRYILQVFDSPAQPLSISGYPSQPRTFGGTLRFKW